MAFFPDDRVIPFDTVDHAADAIVQLKNSGGSPRTTPFEANYVELDADTVDRFGQSGIGAVAWAYPLTPSAGLPFYPVYLQTTEVEVERNVPDDPGFVAVRNARRHPLDTRGRQRHRRNRHRRRVTP